MGVAGIVAAGKHSILASNLDLF